MFRQLQYAMGRDPITGGVYHFYFSEMGQKGWNENDQLSVNSPKFDGNPEPEPWIKAGIVFHFLQALAWMGEHTQKEIAEYQKSLYLSQFRVQDQIRFSTVPGNYWIKDTWEQWQPFYNPGSLYMLAKIPGGISAAESYAHKHQLSFLLPTIEFAKRSVVSDN